MSNRDDTKKLYAEYRVAMRERDDKKAYIILRKITEIIPEDSTVKMQYEAMAGNLIEARLELLGHAKDRAEVKRILAELESLFSQTQLNKYGDYVKAKGGIPKATTRGKGERLNELRRSLRDALLSREKERAFNLLEEICELEPTDRDAQQQKKETGKLLCSQYAGEMQRLTHSGNMPELSDLIDRMRRWANTTILEKTEGYKVADELVNQYQRQETQKEIKRRLAALRVNTELSVKGRYEEVKDIENKAEKYTIELSGEDAAYMCSVKTAWEEEEYARKRGQVLAELSNRYTDIQNSSESISNVPDQLLSEMLPVLGDILRQATALGDYPDVREFSDTVLHKLTNIRRLLKHRRKMRQLKVFVKGAAPALAFSLLVLVGYACYNSYSAIKKMKSIRDEIKYSEYTNDNMSELRVLTSSTPFGFELTKLFFVDHQVTFCECVNFVKRFDDLKSELARVTSQMRVLYENIDPGNPDVAKVREYVPLIRTAGSLMGELSREYHYKLSSEERQTEQDYQVNVAYGMKPRFFARYTTLPTTATLDELERLWAEYKDLSVVFAFSEREKNAIYAAFSNATRDILLCVGKPGGAEISDLRSGLRLFDKYRESMELDGGLRDEIVIVLKKYEDFEKIDDKLLNVLSLDEYLYTVDGMDVPYLRVPDLYDYRPLKMWYEDESGGDRLKDLAVREKAATFHDLLRQGGCDRELLIKIKRIFEEEKGVYLEYSEGSIGVVIDRITKDNKNEGNIWKEGLKIAIDKGVIYPGNRSGINNTISVRLLDEHGNESGKIYRSQTMYGGRELKFADMREKIGFVSKNMLKGGVLPVSLLHRTAMECRNSSYPVLALAWLFKETINLMEAYPVLPANGIALSPSLKKDINEFKTLTGRMKIRKGCWLQEHSLQDEKDLISFFTKYESKNYRAEILQNLNAILNARLLYAGYIGENGQPLLSDSFRGMTLYCIVQNQEDGPRLEPVTARSKLQRYTPVFVLK